MQITQQYTLEDQSEYQKITKLVTIIILNFNKPLLTINCLESIWEHTDQSLFEIIVVDNGSNQSEYDQLLSFKGKYRLLRLDKNRFYGEGNNIGFQAASSEFILFMNNDVLVQPGWLSPLIQCFDQHPDCGAAGPKFIYPDGALQEAGALLDEEGLAVQIGKYQDPDFVSAACILMRKTVFEAVGGFDFIYEPAYYEDVDLCLKISQTGLKTYYISSSCVIHHESKSNSDPLLVRQDTMQQSFNCNKQKFVKRWHKYLHTAQHEPIVEVTVSNPLEPSPIFQSQITFKTAALFTPYHITPGGGERYLFSLAQACIQAGYQTWLVLPEIYSELRIHNIAKVFGYSLKGIHITSLDRAQKMPLFDWCFVIGNEIPPPIKPLGKVNWYICQFPFPEIQVERDLRKGNLEYYQKILAYSTYSQQNIARQLAEYRIKKPSIEILSPPVPLQAWQETKPTKNILSVGRFFINGHCKQHHLLIKAFRKLYQPEMGIELHLAGSLAPGHDHLIYLLQCQELAKGLPIHFHIDASAIELSTLYRDCAIYWHGGGLGIDLAVEPEKCEHFGITILEAMSAGIITIAVNNGGPAEIISDGVDGFLYNSENELVELTNKILNAIDAEFSNLRLQARKRAEQFSEAIFNNAIQKYLLSYDSSSKSLNLELKASES